MRRSGYGRMARMLTSDCCYLRCIMWDNFLMYWVNNATSYSLFLVKEIEISQCWMTNTLFAPQILWPNSGWLPVPLADIIETSQVKKSYQKARLCLHPDKLQQRGATSQQKYIADKAFSILQVSLFFSFFLIWFFYKLRKEVVRIVVIRL